MQILFTPKNTRLKLLTDLGGNPSTGLEFEADFRSTYQTEASPEAGIGQPDIANPNSLVRLHPKPSRRVVTSLLGASVLVGGVEVSEYVVSFDLLRPIHGETAGTVQLESSRGLNLDPLAPSSPFVTGTEVSITVDLAGFSTPLLLGGYLTEPPVFRLLGGFVQSLRLAVGDLLLLKRQSEQGRIQPYCGELPRSTAQAAQIYANSRGVPGAFGGEAVVENLNPDFVEGPPWDFLASLYEPLNYDVRTNSEGTPIAIPRGTYNPDSALKISSEQALEAYLDSPVSKPFSVVRGYNNFARGQGFISQTPTSFDYSRWDASNTAAWFINNNTYEVLKQVQLGNTIVQEIRETWGYLPDSTVVPTGSRPGPTEGPCGEFIPAPEVPTVTTTLSKIAERTTRLFFEPHISGGFLVNRKVEVLEGWATYRLENGDTQLYFGDLEGLQEAYTHTAIPSEQVCPQYWEVIRTRMESYRYKRVDVQEFSEPEYRLVQKDTESWSRAQELTADGEVIQWSRSGESSAYDTNNARWIGGSSPSVTESNPPTGQMITQANVPTKLEAVVEFPELTALFGRREAKPIQFSNAYTYRDLATAIDRYARETAGLAFALHLVIDPRIPVRPGASIEYRRPDGAVIQGLAWSVEYNCTGAELTQSVILMRTFTEPGFLSQRLNPGYRPNSSVTTDNACF